MEKSEMMSKLQSIMRDIADNDDLTITPESEITDSEGWDSLSRINLFSSLDREFSIKFTITDIEKLKSVSDIITILSRKS
jgi:acyl carrier protein